MKGRPYSSKTIDMIAAGRNPGKTEAGTPTSGRDNLRSRRSLNGSTLVEADSRALVNPAHPISQARGSPLCTHCSVPQPKPRPPSCSSRSMDDSDDVVPRSGSLTLLNEAQVKTIDPPRMRSRLTHVHRVPRRRARCAPQVTKTTGRDAILEVRARARASFRIARGMTRISPRPPSFCARTAATI